MALRIGRRSLFGLAIVVTLLWAFESTAQVQYSMNGAWGSRKGAIVQVPQLGNTNCISHVMGLNAGTFGTATPFPPPAAQPLQIPANPGKPWLGSAFAVGCVAGSGTAEVNRTRTANGALGTAPASFIMPTGAFLLPTPAVKNVTPVPNVPGVLQFGEQAKVSGPLASPSLPLNTSSAAPAANWLHFHRDAWMTQTGRPGVDFTACWGGAVGPPGAVGGCGNINQGTLPLLIKYRGSDPGQNFGGTAGLIFDNTVASPSTLAVTQGPGLPAGAVAIRNNPDVGTGLGGRGYRGTVIPAPNTTMVYLSFSTTPAQTPQGGTGPVLAGLGPAIATNVGPIASLAMMPFTVGSVMARNTGGTRNGNPLTVTMSAKGNDSRTEYGLGQIQLVAGGLIASSGNTPTVDIVTLEFVPEPGSTMLLVAGGLYLVGISRLRKQRR